MHVISIKCRIFLRNFLVWIASACTRHLIQIRAVYKSGGVAKNLIIIPVIGAIASVIYFLDTITPNY